MKADNIIHFVYPVWPETRPLSYLNYIAVVAAKSIQKPDHIYFWVNKVPDNGGWWDAIKPHVHLMFSTHLNAPSENSKQIAKYPQYASDIVRLDIMYQYGGIYLDTDMILLKPLDEFLYDDITLCYEAFAGEPQSICNALLVGNPKSVFIHLWKSILPMYLNGKWAEGGVRLPFIISESHAHLVNVKPPSYFCPFDLQKNWLLDTDPFAITCAEQTVENSYAIHAFETFWRNELLHVTPEWCAKNDSLFSRIAKQYQ